MNGSDVKKVCYASGLVVRAGDVLGPGFDVDGHISRVVLVAETGEYIDEFSPENWPNLRSGVLVEQINAGGRNLIHYPLLDKDIELFERAGGASKDL